MIARPMKCLILKVLLRIWFRDRSVVFDPLAFSHPLRSVPFCDRQKFAVIQGLARDTLRYIYVVITDLLGRRGWI